MGGFGRIAHVSKYVVYCSLMSQFGASKMPGAMQTALFLVAELIDDIVE